MANAGKFWQTLIGHYPHIHYWFLFERWKLGIKKIKVYENKPVILPAGLHTVEFGDMFNQPIELPASLHTVKFGDDFNQSITIQHESQISIIPSEFHHLVKIENQL